MEEAALRGWKSFDVILVSGDAYIDVPHSGIAVIGHLLMDEGYRVGIIPQPDVSSADDISRLGSPGLFWGVSSGSVDSMISNYTPLKKPRRKDDLTPGGVNDRRPDRAVIAYVNLIRRYFKDTVPVVIGGVEASMRRLAHYDYWSGSVRRSVLADSKADLLVYGMGEKAVLGIAEALRNGRDAGSIPGTCVMSPEPRGSYIMLPSYEECAADDRSFEAMFLEFYRNSSSPGSRGMCQKTGGRYVVHNPPQVPLTAGELDRVCELPYERSVHPVSGSVGKVKAVDTVRFSIASHRGCYGECSFCSITVHQGRAVTSRSEGSIIRETEALARMKLFRGIVQDVGGPTANMYGTGCRKMKDGGVCADKKCLYPSQCASLKADHEPQISLLVKLRSMKGVRKVFISSGIRHDMVLNDARSGGRYMEELVKHHVSGQMKVAPEHSERRVLDLMGKPDFRLLVKFVRSFRRLNRRFGKNQFLTYYFIAAHPGCTIGDMEGLAAIVKEELGTKPEQVQIYTPSPSTLSALMYYTGRDPFTGKGIFVERGMREKEKQKAAIVRKRET
jgi:uncharacterized radical SAM protein YgiQ